MAGEFDTIQHHFTRPARREDVSLGPGDDGALLLPSAGCELVATTDTSIAGRHFPPDMPAADIGWRVLAVNLSDLAAMGADPSWFMLALTLPEIRESWVAAFAQGLYECADASAIELVGGDLTRGETSITIQAMGQVPRGRALRRDGARPGDVICVTGTLGDAALALELLRSGKRAGGKETGGADADWLMQRFRRPEPRIREGLVLRAHAHACIDLSDGFAADLGHILRASHAGAVIHAEKLPLSDPARHLCDGDPAALQCMGDDYELCVCLAEKEVERVRGQLDCPLTPVGRITADPGMRWLRDGVEEPVPSGYDHFHNAR